MLADDNTGYSDECDNTKIKGFISVDRASCIVLLSETSFLMTAIESSTNLEALWNKVSVNIGFINLSSTRLSIFRLRFSEELSEFWF